MAKNKRFSESLKVWLDNVARTAPARLTVGVFVLIIGTFTSLLCLPIATHSGHSAHFADALFNATSAVCVTGLVTVDTAHYWSLFGLIVLMLGMKIGGLGVMTLASILALAVSRHIGLTQRMLAAGEKGSNLGEVGSLIRSIIIVSTTVETLIATVLFPRFITLDLGIIKSAWYSIFTAISIFNNAGFVVIEGGLEPLDQDWWIVMPIIVGTCIGAVGFPVSLDVSRHWRNPRKWSLHTKLTLTTYGVLFALGAIVIGTIEWNNPNSIGNMPTAGKILNSLLWGANSRSSGIATVPISELSQASWFLQDILMFIGGGSASTAGGIKVTTFAVMFLAIVTEARGDRDIEAFGRRIPQNTIRLAVVVVAIGAILVGSATILMLIITEFDLAQVLFETISAFATVGLSTGITEMLPPAAKVLLSAMMFTGRIGTMTFAAALAMRQRGRIIRMPEESPAIG